MTAEQAIERSVSHNEIVTLEWDSVVFDDLLVESEDSTRGEVHEFWGVRDGREWRVHMRATVSCGCGHCVATTVVRDGAANDGWGTSDDGEWYCPDCLDYSCDEGGQPVCPTHGAT